MISMHIYYYNQISTYMENDNCIFTIIFTFWRIVTMLTMDFYYDNDISMDIDVDNYSFLLLYKYFKDQG